MSTKTKVAQFVSEDALVVRLVTLLRSGTTQWGPVDIETEWNYISGFTDVLACTAAGEIVAFEAKLRDWRTAIHQAYRNTTFARRAFVVMPAEAATRVVRGRHEFERHGVGLIGFDGRELEFFIDAPRKEDPLILPWMHERARAHFADIARRRESRFARRSKGNLQPA